MRIIVIGAALGADTMEKHVVSTLDDMGHQAVHFNARDILPIGGRTTRLVRAAASRLLREPELLVEKRLIETVEHTRPDMILTLLGSMLSPKTVSKIKRATAAPLICWCQDQMTTLGRQYLIGADYNVVFLKDQYLVDQFRNLAGLDAHYLAEACNPATHRSEPCSTEELKRFACDICTYGNLYYFRQRLLEQLTDYDVRFWGTLPGWLVNRVPEMVQGRGIYETDKAKALGAAKIVLNSLHFGEVGGLNARCFEVAGCGGFQLVSHSPAVEEHFAVGSEIDVFRSAEELREKIDYYLARPDLRSQIASAGQHRAYREHTYRHRLERIFEVAGLPGMLRGTAEPG